MKKIDIVIQGIKGSYSHQAVDTLSKKLGFEYNLVESSDFDEAFRKIKKTGIGLIPVENSTAGFVEQTIDELLKNNFEIIGEFSLEINHTLLGIKKTNLKKIKEVYSHKQALLQTSKFLKKNKIKPIEYFDTAMGAEKVAEWNDSERGAIGSEILAEIYGLKILARDINNEKDNRTRFFLIKKKDFDFKWEDKFEKEKSALIFTAKNIPGGLYKILGAFATNGINLVRIISRPVDGEKFQYYFFVVFEGNLSDQNVKQALKEVKFFSQRVKNLGEFGEIKK